MSAISSAPATYLSMAINSTEVTAGAIVGCWDTLSPVDLSAMNIICSFTPVSGSRLGDIGNIVVFADNSGNWKAFLLATNAQASMLGSYITRTITLDSADSVLDSSGVLDATNIQYVGMFYHRIGSSPTGNAMIIWDILAVEMLSLVGGGANQVAKPSRLRKLAREFSWGEVATMSVQGVDQSSPSCSVCFGDGITPTVASLSGCATEPPAPYDSKGQYLVSATAEHINVVVKASAGCTMDFSNSLFSSPRPATFTIDSASDLDAAYNFSGMVLSGYRVIWKTGVECNSAVLSKGPELDGKAATFLTCTISGSTGTHALALDAGGSAAGTRFTKGSEIYAINLRTAGAYNLSGCTFSGYANPLHITATTGTVTITLADGQSVPGYVSDGATVMVAPKSVSITISGMAEGSVLAAYKISDGAAIISPTTIGATGSYSTTYSYTGDTQIEVVARKGTSGTKYLPYSAPGLITSTGFSLIVNQVIDGVLNG